MAQPRLKDMASGRSDCFKIDPKTIKIKPDFNKRIDYGNIEELAQSIQENGLREPLKVYIENGEVFLSSGHRRMAAINSLLEKGIDIDPIPCLSDGQKANNETRLLDQILCNEGKQYNMLEQGLVFQELIQIGQTQAQIAKKVGKTQGHISNCLLIANSSEEIKNKIINKEVECSVVLGLLRESKNNDLANAALNEAITSQGETNSENKRKVTTRQINSILNGGKVKNNPQKQINNLVKWFSVNKADKESHKNLDLFLKYINNNIEIEELINNL